MGSKEAKSAAPAGSGLDGLWGDWGKRLSESTQAIQSDFLQRVDEIQKTVQDTPSSSGAIRAPDPRVGGPAAATGPAKSQDVALAAENKLLKEQLAALRKQGAPLAQDSPDPSVMPEEPIKADPPTDQVADKIATLEKRLVEAAERETELRSFARAKVNDLKAEHESTKRMLADREALVARLTEKTPEADDGLSRAPQTQAQENAKVAELLAQLNEKNDLIGVLEKKALAAEESLQEKVKILEQGSGLEDRSPTAALEEDSSIQAELEELRDKLATLQSVKAANATLEQSNAELTEKLRDLQSKEEAENPQQSALADILDRVTKEKDTLASQLTDSKAHVDRLKTDLAKSQQSFAATRKRLVSAEEGANRAEKAALDLKKQMDTSKSLSKGTDKRMAEKNAQLEEMSQTLKSFQEELDAAHKRLADADAKGSSREKELRNQLEKAQEDERAATDAFRATESRNVSIAEELDRAMKALDEKKTTIEKLDNSIAKERTKRDDAQNALTSLNREYATYKDRVALVVTQREEETSHLEVQLTEAKSKLENLARITSSRTDLESQAEEEQSQVATLTREVELLRSELDKLKNRTLDNADLGGGHPVDSGKILAETSLALEKEKLALEQLSARLLEVEAENERLTEKSLVLQHAEVALREQHEQELSVIRSKVASLQRELRRLRPESVHSNSGHQGQKPGSFPSSPIASLEGEYKLRAEQLEKQVWQLRKEVGRLSNSLQEVLEKNDTVGSLMSL